LAERPNAASEPACPLSGGKRKGNRHNTRRDRSAPKTGLPLTGTTRNLLDFPDISDVPTYFYVTFGPAGITEVFGQRVTT